MEMTYTTNERGVVNERSETCKTCDKDVRDNRAWCKCPDSKRMQGLSTQCNYGNCCGHVCANCGKWI